MIDFAKLDTLEVAEKGFFYTFIHPVTQKETDCVIEVYGVGSKKYKAYDKKIEEYRLQCARKGVVPDDEVIEDLSIALLVACTKGWVNMGENGKEVPFSPEEAERMYKAYPLLSNQVSKAIFSVVEQLEKN